MGHGVESCSIQGVFLNNFVEEKEWILRLIEAIVIYEALMSCVSECIELLFEGCSPLDTILFLFLNVLAWHVSGVIKQSHVPLHHILTVCTCFNAVIAIDTLLYQFLSAHRRPRRLMEVLLGCIVDAAHLDLFGCVGK